MRLSAHHVKGTLVWWWWYLRIGQGRVSDLAAIARGTGCQAGLRFFYFYIY